MRGDLAMRPLRPIVGRSSQIQTPPNFNRHIRSNRELRSSLEPSTMGEGIVESLLPSPALAVASIVWYGLESFLPTKMTVPP